MTHPKNKLAAEKEAQLQLAIAAVLNHEHTCHSAAIAFDVPAEPFTIESMET